MFVGQLQQFFSKKEKILDIIFFPKKNIYIYVSVFLHIQHVPSLNHCYVLTDWNPLFYFE